MEKWKNGKVKIVKSKSKNEKRNQKQKYEQSSFTRKLDIKIGLMSVR